MKGYCLWYFKYTNFVLLNKLNKKDLVNIAHPRKTSHGGKILWLLSVGFLIVSEKWHLDT